MLQLARDDKKLYNGSMKIVPAILSNNPIEFAEQYNKLAPYFDHFSIDVLDGKFADNHTIQPKDIMLLIKTGILKNVETKTFDFDLMVMDFNTAISDLKNLASHMPIKRTFIHTKALKTVNVNIDDIPSIGLAIDKPDQINDLYKYNNLNNVPYIQIMTIESGFQGKPFELELMNKITQLREYGYGSEIFIDGGVNDTTIDTIIRHPNHPDFACCGSFLTKADNIQERVEYLKKMRVY